MLLEGGQQVAQAAGVARVAQNGNDAGDAATPSGTCEAAQAVLADESCAAPRAVAHEVDAARQRLYGGARQFEVEVLRQKHTHAGQGVIALLPAPAEHHEVVDVAAVAPRAQGALDELIKRIKVNQGVKLT